LKLYNNTGKSNNNSNNIKNLYCAQRQSVGRIGGAGSHWWHMAGLKSSSKIICFKLCLNELTDGEMQLFRGMAFQICGAA